MAGLPGAIVTRRPSRHPLLITGLAPLVPILIGSAVNIWYNLTQIDPLLTARQRAIFVDTVTIFNLAVYPPAVAVWAWAVASLRRPLRALLAGEPIPDRRLAAARRRVINLPYCVAALVRRGLAPLHSGVPVGARARRRAACTRWCTCTCPCRSSIGGMIAIAHAFFGVEILSRASPLPRVLPRDARRGARRAPTRSRCASAASCGRCRPACARSSRSCCWRSFPAARRRAAFAMTVGAIGIAFGLHTAWLVGRLVTEPIDDLTRGAEAVGAGDLGVMIEPSSCRRVRPAHRRLQPRWWPGCARRRASRRTSAATSATRWRARSWRVREGLGGAEEEVTVLFLDIRGFTARAARATPTEIVALLNVVLRRDGGGDRGAARRHRHGGPRRLRRDTTAAEVSRRAASTVRPAVPPRATASTGAAGG